MIFVALGTQDKSFKRLMDYIQNAINKNIIKEKVIAQVGHTKFESNDIEIIDYISTDEFNEYVKKCDIFITHGGVGNILTALKNNKKIIACPRLKKYKEHTNDHQLQIINNLYEEGYILKIDEEIPLEEVLKKINSFRPKKWKSNNGNIIKKIIEFIENN